MTKNYYYDGSRLIAEKWSTGAYLLYHYDENSSIYAVTYSSTGSGFYKYYLLKNLQGDVVQILNASNDVVANYSYDAWGNLLEVTDANEKVITSTTNFALINPIRYRGYYYDSETGFYYLKSRYYDPANCRFISADTRLDLSLGTTNLNLFAYCGNDPVNRVDPSGKVFLGLILTVVALTSIAVVPLVEAGVQSAGGAAGLSGSAFLRSIGYELAACMYEHAFVGGGKALNKDTVPPMMAEKLKNANELKSELSPYMTSVKNSFDTGDKTVQFKESRDLFYSVQHVNYRAWGQRENGRWKIDIIVWDTYDFGELRLISEGISFANAANDLGTSLESVGQMIPYEWWTRYEYYY